MISFPNAKINLGLNVVSKRPDGYHNLETCFYPTSWCDGLEIIESNIFQFSSSGISIPGELNTNLCINAYKLLKEVHDLPPVHIHLHKVIPIGAGLGGGSSDAAFIITLLNKKFGLNLFDAQMENYARKLGSDCAFFIQNKPVFAKEKGDVFEPISINLKGYFLLLVYPHIHVSTATAYSGIVPKSSSINLKESMLQNPSNWEDSVENDFEMSVFAKFPALGELKNELYRMGADYAAMSGSGSTVFGVFSKQPDKTLFDKKSYLTFMEEIRG
jgi:4-diphosphocytidyl-2-C-methyl-D-erythritol kinase